jgi:hypothetical protein
MTKFLFLLFWFLPLLAQATPRLTVSVSPNRSLNGEPVIFKIDVQVDSSGRVGSPSLEQLDDWELVNSFKSGGSRVTYINGKVQYQYKAEFSYILRPLKSGKVTIPSVDVEIEGRKFKTDPITVTVDRLPGGLARRDRRNYNIPSPAPSPKQAPIDPSLGLGRGNTQSQTPDSTLSPQNIPTHDSFFVRPEISTTHPWSGQLVELSYVLYQRTRNLRNFEMAKFPDFKGFLKEELFITKNFAQERVRIGDEIMFRSEIIRYALFPIKSGKIKIDPFEVRAEVFTSPDDLINSLITGSLTPNIGGSIPTTKSSGAVELNVRELPPTPPNVTFAGAVGQFNIEIKGPREKLSVDQPFTIEFTIGGKGNVKMIEEAPLPLPPALELYQTKNSSELRPDTSGYKTFEYLILPRAKGQYVLPSFKWAYFDPATSEYKVLQTEELSFQIEGGTPIAKPDTGKEAIKERSLHAFDVIEKPLQKRNSQSQSLWFGVSAFLGLLYAFLGYAFFKRRNQDQFSMRLKDNPWEKTALDIKLKRYKTPVQLCILVDQWSREYLSGHLKGSDLHSESPRSEFERVLRDRMPYEFHSQIAELSSFWNDLDLARFAGSQKWPIHTRPEQLFPKAEEICRKLISRCKSLDDLQISEEDDEED